MSAQLLAASVVANLNSLGISQFFIAPGSRSQALAIAAEQLAKSGKATTRVRIDERSLGFMALGASMATKAPTAVIVTSGTAVGNLLPAAMEAHHSGVPVVFITADRPAELQNRGANQTTNQENIFGDFVFDSITIEATDSESEVAAAVKRIANSFLFALSKNQPLHLNLRFREPLSAKSPTVDGVLLVDVPSSDTTAVIETEIDHGVAGVVIAGAGANGAAEFAQAANWPIFAEPSSGERFGESVIIDYSQLLETDLAQQINTVVVFGKPTLNRSVVKLIRNSANVFVVKSTTHGFFDIGSNAIQLDAATVSQASQPLAGWLDSWKELDKPVVDFAGKVCQLVWDQTKVQDSLLFGASKIIRAADRSVSGKQLNVFSNRGLAGIDGSISTAVGIALNTKGTTRALIGDITLLHDIGSLNRSGFEDLDLQLIIFNDGGGQIFSGLEVRDSVASESFEKLFQTPQQFQLDLIAAGFGWDYQLVTTVDQLKQAIAAGSKIIEIRV